MKKYLIIFIVVLFCAEVGFGRGYIYIEGRSHASFYNTEISKIRLKSQAINSIGIILEHALYEDGCLEGEFGDTLSIRYNMYSMISEFVDRKAKIFKATWEGRPDDHTDYNYYTIHVKIDYDDLIEFVETERDFIGQSIKLRLNHKRFCEVIETIPSIKAEGLYRMTEEEYKYMEKIMEEKFKHYKEENQ